jgi:hypothetical protein
VRSGAYLTLHQRIEPFKTERNSEVGTLLLALKWIGNDGAHDGSKLLKNNILEAYGSLLWKNFSMTMKKAKAINNNYYGYSQLK